MNKKTLKNIERKRYRICKTIDEKNFAVICDCDNFNMFSYDDFEVIITTTNYNKEPGIEEKILFHNLRIETLNQDGTYGVNKK